MLVAYSLLLVGAGQLLDRFPHASVNVRRGFFHFCYLIFPGIGGRGRICHTPPRSTDALMVINTNENGELTLIRLGLDLCHGVPPLHLPTVSPRRGEDRPSEIIRHVIYPPVHFPPRHTL